MNQFQDAYLPDQVWGIPAHATPRFSTRMTLSKSADESRTSLWKVPLRKFQLPLANMNFGEIEDLLNHFIIMDGPKCTWPWRDPLDYASCAPVPPDEGDPPITPVDQFLGAGDGVTSQFQLMKMRTFGGFSRVRNIYLPVVDSVVISINGHAPEDVPSGFPLYGPYEFVSVTRPGGIVTISPAPSVGCDDIRSGYLWDAEVRWEADDSLQAAIESMDTQSVAPLNFVEVPRC
jgi:uncharacterized protein (TIGR02217 family)